MTRVQRPCLGAWLVHCPGAHACWSHWLVSVVSLADCEGLPPANKHYPAAAFEIMFAALDPHEPVDPDGTGWPIMTPLDLAHQFHGVTEVDAARVLELCVDTIMRGSLSPDFDWRRAWEAKITSAVHSIVAARALQN